MEPREDLYDRYLEILGVRPGAAGLELLQRIVRAQVIGAPFENVSKLWSVRRFGRRSVPTLAEYLDGIETHGLGGTCYTNNLHLWSLLRHLGFDVSLCGADMVSGPDVHVVILARVDDREYWVDAGYAAPFFQPLRADLKRDQTLRHGRDHYVLRARDADGRSRLDHFRNGERIHGYLAKPIPRSPGHFEKIIRASYADSATFMNALAVVRYHDDGSSVAIYNDRLIRSTADACSVTRLADREAIVRAVERHCGIPADIVQEATSGLVEFRSVHPAI